jgi:large subunit ribosomal protein L18
MALSKIQVRHARIRKKVSGTAERPRLAVHFSGKNIYAQVIDDTIGKTLASVQTTEKAFRAETKNVGANKATAEKVGTLVADLAKSKNISAVVFDRGGFKYHGKVKVLADAARAGGLQF